MAGNLFSIQLYEQGPSVRTKILINNFLELTYAMISQTPQLQYLVVEI